MTKPQKLKELTAMNTKALKSVVTLAAHVKLQQNGQLTLRKVKKLSPTIILCGLLKITLTNTRR